MARVDKLKKVVGSKFSLRKLRRGIKYAVQGSSPLRSLSDNQAAIFDNLTKYGPRKKMQQHGITEMQKRNLLKDIRQAEKGTEHEMSRTDVHKLKEILNEISAKKLQADAANKSRPKRASYRERAELEKQTNSRRNVSTSASALARNSASREQSDNKPAGAVSSASELIKKPPTSSGPTQKPPKPPSIGLVR